MYLNDVWYCAALDSEISRSPLRRMICSEPIVFYRTEAGEVIALEDRCSHRQAPLSLGRVVDDNIQCMYHGFMFNGKGACIYIPHVKATPKSARIRTYPAVERWGYVWLWRGDVAAADPDLIPSLPWTQDPAWRNVYFYWHVKANFQIAADNLLDESHTDFLHRKTIGSDTGMEGQEGTQSLTSRVEGRTVHCTRKVIGTKLSPVAAKWAGSEKLVTRSNTQMWEAPNTIHMLMQFKNEETDRSVHMEHIMTPETETSTHYFLNWTRNFTIENEAYPTDSDVRSAHTLVDGSAAGIVDTDDIPMMEAIQRNLGCAR